MSLSHATLSKSSDPFESEFIVTCNHYLSSVFMGAAQAEPRYEIKCVF